MSAPPYRGEGAHALWHLSEEPAIERFEPRDGRVWAIDTRYVPLYWFPRDCPRATFWPTSCPTRHSSRRTYWISTVPAVPIERIELPDLLTLHADAEIELRIAPQLLDLWERVIASTLDFSGIRLRNATLAR